jgi:D-glycero-D-manno-heptose 1,7-bisphosphate phosphatase
VKPAVFLDRDGVLNEPVIRAGKPYPPMQAGDVVICKGAGAALDQLRSLGFSLVCVTNQPDVARGTLAGATLDAINAHLMSALPLDAMCDCRKPKPGLIHQAAARLGLDASSSYLVGDRWRDIEAGAAASCRTILIDRGYQEKSSVVPPDAVVTSITAAAEWIAADVLRKS